MHEKPFYWCLLFCVVYPVGYFSDLMSILKTELSHGVKCIGVFVAFISFLLFGEGSFF